MYKILNIYWIDLIATLFMSEIFEANSAKCQDLERHAVSFLYIAYVFSMKEAFILYREFSTIHFNN